MASIKSNKNSPHGKLEYSKITYNIYIGTNLCCQTHFEEELLSSKIDSDISLESGKIDAAFGATVYLWLPVKDRQAPTQEQLLLGTRMINTLIGMNKKIYIHCKRGHGRAPTLVAAYFISQGMSVKEALNFLKKRRPAVHPNRKQINALKKFEESARIGKLGKSLFL